MTGQADVMTMDGDRPLAGRQLRRFWTPLVLTSLLMTLSGPLINVAIGRASEPTLEFAGFWVAFTIMLFIQSASLVIQQVTVVLVDAGDTLRRLAISAFLLGLAATTMILVVAQTPLGALVFHSMIPTTARVSELARAVLTQLALVPILVAVRDVAIGVAIRERRTTLVAASTMVRVVVLSCVVGVVVVIGTGSGARAAAWALVSGIAVETAFILATTYPAWRTTLRHRRGEPPGVSYRGILRIAAPLAVAAVVWTAVRPVVSAILGRLPDSELAQAGFGVVLPILMVGCSPLWGLHNVSLVLPRDRADLRQVIRFAAGVTTVIAVAIGIVTLTPLKLLVLRLGFDLSPEMERVVAPALSWMALAPFFLTARAIAQGLLMKARRTGVMLIVSPIKLVLMVAIGFAATTRTPAPDGATLAILLVIGGDLFDAVIFGLLARRLIDRGLVFRVRPQPTEAGEPRAIGIAWSVARPALGNDG